MTRALARILLRFARRQPLRLAGAMLLALATLVAAAGLLSVSGGFVTGAALVGIGFLAGLDTFGPSALVRFFALTRTLARYGERLTSHDATLRFLSGLRVDVFRGMVAAGDPGGRPGRLFSRLAGDLEALDGAVIRLLVPLGAALTMLGGTAVALAAIDGTLATAVVLPLLLGGIAAPIAIGRRSGRATRTKLAALDAGRQRFVDLDRGRAALQADRRFAAQAAIVADAFARVEYADGELAGHDALLRFCGQLGAQGAVVGTLAAGSGLVAAGTLDGVSFASLVVFSFVLGEAIAPFRGIALDLGRWQVGARRIEPLAAAGSRPPPPPAPFGPAPAIQISDLAVGAGGGRLAGIRLAIAPAEKVALVGPSGSGKSTLLAALAGLEAPTAGRIVREPPGAVGWLGQRTELFRGTVADNLRLADPDADAPRLEAAIRAVRLSEALGVAGLGLQLGDGGAGLSGGERRRLALARLLLRPASLLLLDEPTEGLDADTAAAVFAALLDHARTSTLLVATHRRSEAEAMDRLVRLESGRIAADLRRGAPGFGCLLAELRD